jgi:hypothetical protein
MLSVVGVTLRANANFAFQRAYHVVWCPKYRRSVIGGRIEARLKEIIAEVVAEKAAWLIEVETMPDQVHLLVEVDPQFRIHKIGEGHQGSLIASAASEVLVAAVSVAYVVDELVFRGHRWRGALVGDQSLCRKPE